MADLIELGGGFTAERRKNGEVAISHKDGGLHMADSGECAMVDEIERIRAQVQELALQCIATDGQGIELMDENERLRAELEEAHRTGYLRGLEEAAKVCEQLVSSTYRSPGWYAEAAVCKLCAADIRALAQKEQK